MAPRVALANDLGELVTETTPRSDIEDHGKLRDRLDEWRTAAKRERMPRGGEPVLASTARASRCSCPSSGTRS